MAQLTIWIKAILDSFQARKSWFSPGYLFRNHVAGLIFWCRHHYDKCSPHLQFSSQYHKRFFGGVAVFARLLSSRVVWCVVYAKVPWLLLHAKYRTCKAKQAAAPFFSRSQHTHNTRREKPVTEGSSSQVLFSFFTSKKLLMLSTAKCNNWLLCSADLVY